MATPVTDDVNDEINRDSVVGELDPNLSSETFTKDTPPVQELDTEESSSYTLASQSQLSSDVDRWIQGSSLQTTGVQNSRVAMVQRSMATTASLSMNSMWCLLAMILPLFSVNFNYNQWRCNYTALVNSVEEIMALISALCQNLKNHIRRLARDQVVRELFATAMDVVLLIYAMGFLVITMYQAAIIG